MDRDDLGSVTDLLATGEYYSIMHKNDSDHEPVFFHGDFHTLSIFPWGRQVLLWEVDPW